MAGSLRDQLIKSGIATAEQARKAERQTRVEKHVRRKAQAAPAPAAADKPRGPAVEATPPAPVPDDARARARQLASEKAERDRALQREINSKAAERALRAQLRQIIVRNDQRTRPAEDDVPYNFLHGRKVKRIYVTAEHRAQLSSGRLVIVNDEGRYALVADTVAEKIRARDPKRIIAAHTAAPAAAQAPAAATPDSDDAYYARFAIPDDLDW